MEGLVTTNWRQGCKGDHRPCDEPAQKRSREMKNTKVVLLMIVFIAFMFGLASAGMQITLKNGRTVIADSCRDVKGKLLCDFEGGTFEIDRQEIERIQDVKVLRQPLRDISDESKATAAEKAPDKEKPLSPEKAEANRSGGKVVDGLTPEQIKRLDEINERKAVLQPERERLIQEREQLHQDSNRWGVIRTQEQFNAIKKRIADLETKIMGFNDEVTKLNEEGKAILDLSVEK
jgi:hypothetical protein